MFKDSPKYLRDTEMLGVWVYVCYECM